MKIANMLSENKKFLFDNILENNENVFLLKELYSAMIRDDDKAFNKILSMPINLLTPFDFEPTTNVSLDGKEVYADASYEGYFSFFCFTLGKDVDKKFIQAIIDKPNKEQYDEYFKHQGLQKSLNIVAKCISTGKSDILQKLLDKGVVTESGVYQVIYFYSNEHLSPFIDKDLLKNPYMLHQAFKEFNTNIYPCALGMEKEHKPTNQNIDIFSQINHRKPIDLIRKAIDSIDFANYQHSEDLVNDIMKLCVRDLKEYAYNADTRFQDLKGFEFINNKVNNVAAFQSRDFEVARLVLHMCKSRLLDIDGYVNIPLTSGEVGKRKISDWISHHEALDSLEKDIRKSLLEKKLNEQKPDKVDMKRAKI